MIRKKESEFCKRVFQQNIDDKEESKITKISVPIGSAKKHNRPSFTLVQTLLTLIEICVFCSLDQDSMPEL